MRTSPPHISVVLPAHNEEAILEKNVARLVNYLRRSLGSSWTIVISENGSTDKTLEIAERLSRKYSKVKVLHVDEAGVGYALRNAWTKCDTEILSYVDADLPFRLDDLRTVCMEVPNGYDIAIGSRYVNGGMNYVPRVRKFLSVLYNKYRKVLFMSRFSDHCGIRAIKREVFLELEPYIRSNGWFFGTELLLLAEHKGHSIKEVPVQAREDPRRVTKMRIVTTIVDYLLLSLKLRLEFMIDDKRFLGRNGTARRLSQGM